MNDHDKNNDRLDRYIDDAAERMREPVNVPRDRMWARIAEARQEQRPARTTADEVDHGQRRWTTAVHRWWPAAAAALLILGFGLGRAPWPSGEQQVADNGAAPADSGSHDVIVPAADASLASTATGEADWNSATDRMLMRAEALLASFAQAPAGAPMANPVPRWAGLLLYETRILMDSPAAEDPELTALLVDLELVLAQITRLKSSQQTTPNELTESPATGPRAITAQDDRTWIADGLEKRATLQRLRAHLGAGSL